VDELSASRRRVWFGLLLSATFVVGLAVALTSVTRPDAVRVDSVASPQSATTTARHRATPTPSGSTTTTAASSATLSNRASEASASASAALHPTVASGASALASTSFRHPSTTTTAKPVVKVPPPTVAAPPPPPPVPPSAAAFLACVRQRESHGNYGAVSPGGTYMGAYQFSQASWDAVARHTGRLDLVGQHPNLVSPADQDAMALAEYEWLGAAPWGGACT
jgi:hypothetical protein